jgi:hypothetical protein
MLPECTIKTYKIVIIVNEAWKHSFSRVEYNKKSIAVRGWCPFTRNLLDHPKEAATKVQSSDNEATMDSQSTAASSKNQQSVAAVLNHQSGFVNIVLSDILQNINHDAIRERIRSNQEKGHHAINAFSDAKMLTAGLVFKSRKAWLGPEVLQVAIANERKIDEQEQAVIQQQNDAMNKRRESYEAVWAAVSHLPTSSWSVQQL